MDTSFLFILGLCLLSVSGQRVITIRRIPSTHILGQSSPQCNEKCKETYSKDSDIESCFRGCRLAEITDALTFTQNDDLNDTIDKCNESCSSSYEASKDDVKSCQRGCAFCIPTLQKRRQNLRSPIEDFFGGGNGGGGFFNAFRAPRIFLSGGPVKIDDGGISKDEVMERNPFIRTKPPTEHDEEEHQQMNPFGSIFGSNTRFQSMFQQMNQLMHQAMEQVHHNLPDMIKGKMIVVKNGPDGSHDVKTYNLGPNGKFKLDDEEDNNNNGNDMMNKVNPLDEFFSDSDAEMLDDPFSMMKDSGEMNEPEIIEDPTDRGFDVELFNPNQLRDFDGPRLPEHGLKTRTRIIHTVCSQNSADMKWSDWVSCVHMRIGMPRWITAAVISLGIVFALWLCLAIPQAAPKRKIIVKSTLTKAAMAKAKEAEANGHVISIVSVKTMDDEKPPAYEDIGSTLRVNLAPLHNTATAQEEVKVPLPATDDSKESKA